MHAVFVVHKHEIDARGWLSLLGSSNITPIGHDEKPIEKLKSANVVLVDCDAPFAPLPRVVSMIRGLSIDCTVVGVTSEDLTIADLSRIGFDKLVHKGQKYEDLLSAVGGDSSSKNVLINVSQEESDKIKLLTGRQEMILQEVLKGKKSEQIAIETNTTESTVNNHKSNIRAKLDAGGDYDLSLKYAIYKSKY